MSSSRILNQSIKQLVNQLRYRYVMLVDRLDCTACMYVVRSSKVFKDIHTLTIYCFENCVLKAP